MALSMAMFSRRKHSEGKKPLSSFSTQKSDSTGLEKCRVDALVSVSSPLTMGSKTTAARGGDFGLVHASRPRASSTATGRGAFCCISRIEPEVTPSQERKVNRSKSQPVSMKMAADMREIPVSNSATVHLNSSTLLSSSTQVTRLPGSSIFQADKLLSASFPETDSANSPAFTGRTTKKPVRPRPVGIISLPTCGFSHFADTSVAPLNVKKYQGEGNDMIVEVASPKKPFLMKDEIFPNLDPMDQPQGSTPLADLQRRNQDLLHRIRELEKANGERDLSLSRHAYKFQALRQSHAALVETMRISYEAEISSLKESIKSMDKTKCVNLATNEELIQLRKREKELTRQVKEKGEELGVAKKDVNVLQGRLADMEKLVARRDGELEGSERRVERTSEQTPILGRVDFTREEEVATLAAKLAEESQLKEKVEKEFGVLVLSDALATERTKSEERQQQELEEQNKKIEVYKYITPRDAEDMLGGEENRIMASAFVQEQLESRIQQEGAQHAEMVAGFKTKFSELVIARKADLDDFEAQMKVRHEAEQALLSKNKELKSRINDLQGLLDKGKNAIESLKSSHQDIMRIAKRINWRLAEEKRRSKCLGEAAQSASPPSVCPPHTNTPSEDSHHPEEVNELELLEDQGGKVEVLRTEVNAWKVELKTVDEVRRKYDAEVKGLQDTLAGKYSKIEELEGQNTELVKILQNYQREFWRLKESTTLGKGIHDRKEEGLGDMIVKAEMLAEGYTNEECGEEPSVSHSHLLEQLLQAQSALAEANREIQLYELDVKGYKKDVRRRDAQITNLNKQITRLQSHGKSVKVLRELGCRRAPPIAPANAPSTTNENIYLFAGKVSSEKDENLHLHHKVGKKENKLQNAIESPDWLKKMQQCSEQHRFVIKDLELKVEKLKKEKERAEEKTRSALMKMAEMKGMLTPLPPPPPTEDGARLNSILTTSPSPTADAQSSASISTVSKHSRRGSTLSRTRSGRTHSRTSSKGVTNIYTVSPTNISISPPRFPSPTTPLPPIPLELPSQSPVAVSPTDARPSTASSDDGLPPLGVLSSPLMAGLHNALPSAQPRLEKLEHTASVSSAGDENDSGSRLSIVFEPPVAERSESPKDKKHKELPAEKMMGGIGKHDGAQLLAEVTPHEAAAVAIGEGGIMETRKVQNGATSEESENVIYW